MAPFSGCFKVLRLLGAKFPAFLCHGEAELPQEPHPWGLAPDTAWGCITLVRCQGLETWEHHSALPWAAPLGLTVGSRPPSPPQTRGTCLLAIPPDPTACNCLHRAL